MEAKKIGLNKDNWYGLTGDEIRAIADWKNTPSYNALQKLLREIRYHHVAKVMEQQLTSNSLIELSERRGMYLEDAHILTLPDLALKEIKKEVDKEANL